MINKILLTKRIFTHTKYLRNFFVIVYVLVIAYLTLVESVLDLN